nr:hypothetical protein [Tanacetum cinerariifolium]
RFPHQADGAQSPRASIPFPEDPYEAIRQACLVETNTESEPFEDPVETETPESPHTVASPTSLPDSTPPIRHAHESEDSDTTARMAVRVPPAMSPGLSASIAKVAAMFDSTFHKRFRSSYEKDDEKDDDEEDEEEEDNEVEEISDSDSKSEDAEDEGPTTEDEGPAAGDEGLAVGDEGPGMRVESLGLGGDEAVHEGQQRAAPVVETTVAPTVQTPPSPEWSSGLLHVSPVPFIVPSPISSPMISLTVSSLVASPATVEAEGFLTELGTKVEMHGGLIHDHTVRLKELSPALFERYDRDIWELFTRSGPIRDEIFSQSLDSWAGYVDAHRAALWHAISDARMENRELRLQITKESQVPIAKTSSTKQPPLKDNSMWFDQEKKIQKIGRLARSFLIQGLPNDIYFLIDSNKTVKDLWDALARQMLDSEYGEQDRKVAVLYEYETFKATEGELFLDTYIRYLQVIIDLKKCANKKQEYVKHDDKKEEKKVEKKKRDMRKFKCYNYKKEGHFSKDCKKSKVKDYDYYKTKMLLAKKDNDEQVLLAEDHAWMDLVVILIRKLMLIWFSWHKLRKFFQIHRLAYRLLMTRLLRKQIADQEILFDKMSHQLVEMDENVRMLKNKVLEKDLKISQLEECVRNKDLEIEKCLERLNDSENKLHKIG